MSAGYTYQPVEHYSGRDMMKHQLAEEKGITLITIPFWWDGTLDRYESSCCKYGLACAQLLCSLTATIKTARPELLSDRKVKAQAISQLPPDHVLEKQTNVIEGIGEPTTASFFTMSHVDPKHWYGDHNAN